MPSLTFDKLIKDTSAKIFIDTRVEDIGSDSTVGGYYQFYKNGRLKRYDFILKATVDTSAIFIQQYGDSIISASSYGEIYDTSGKLDSTYGRPLV